MKRSLACLLVFVFLLLSMSGASAELLSQNNSFGEPVVRVQLRLRELGYFFFKPTGTFRAITVSAVKSYQSLQVKTDGNPMIADGTVGDETMSLLFLPTATRNNISQSIPFGSTSKLQPNANDGTLLGWPQVKEQLRVGQAYSVTDYYSRETFSMVYTGGEGHAEMECASAADTAIYKTVFGGEFNYSKRPVLLLLGDTYVAASLQGEPHGADTVSGNDMQGHACLYFQGSRSHVGSLSDVEHVNQVQIAAGRTQAY